MKLLIKNGVVNDPVNNIVNEKLSILCEDGRISKVQKELSDEGVDEVIDAEGLFVFPGLFDMHVHLREPGEEHKESIASGSLSAAAGGFTSIACMANTHPPIDSASQVKYVVVTAEREAAVNVFPYGAVTRGLKGDLITEMGDMLEAGAIAFSDDGHNIRNSGTMRRALEYLRMFNVPIIVHPEDIELVGTGTVNTGFFAETKGLMGIPKEAEEIIVARDIQLARLTGGRVHFTHISTKGSVDLIRRAKKEGVSVTCDTTPHHIALTTEDIGDYNTNMKMNPPLRDEEDLLALKEGLLDGTIDAVGTDHAPHGEGEKELEFNSAPNGVIGLETAVPVVLDRIIMGDVERMPLFAKLLSSNPAQILGTTKGTLTPGGVADITVVDMNCEYVYTRDMIVSKSKNSPFLGVKLKGAATHTVVDGTVIYTRNEG